MKYSLNELKQSLMDCVPSDMNDILQNIAETNWMDVEDVKQCAVDEMYNLQQRIIKEPEKNQAFGDSGYCYGHLMGEIEKKAQSYK